MLKAKQVQDTVKPALAAVLEPAGFRKEKLKGGPFGWFRDREDGRREHVRAAVPHGMPWWTLHLGVSIPGDEPTLHPAFEFLTDELRGQERQGGHGLPPSPRMLDPERGGFPAQDEARLQRWVALVPTVLLDWVEHAVALDDALHGALEHGCPRPVRGARPLVVEPATAFIGGFEHMATVDRVAGPATFSADGRWLSIHEPGQVRIVDPPSGTVMATVPMSGEPPYRHAVHPGGKTLAVRAAEGIEVRGSGGLVHRVDRPAPPRFDVDLLWDGQGRLWITDVAMGESGELAVYDAELRRLAATEVPAGSVGAALDEAAPRRWYEPSLALHAASGTVLCAHMAGNSFLSLTFHRLEEGGVVTATPRVSGEEPGRESDAIRDLAVDPLGREVVARDGHGRLVRWALPGCRPTVHGMPDPITGDRALGPISHLGGAIMALSVDGEGWTDDAWMYDPDDLHVIESRPVLHPQLAEVDVAGPWIAGLDGRKLAIRKLVGEQVPALRIRTPAIGAWMRGEAEAPSRVERILRPVEGRFEDVTSKAVWSRRGRLVPSAPSV